MKLLTITSSFILFIVSVAGVDLRREVYTLSVFCDAWNTECAAQANTTGQGFSECTTGYDGNGTASASCASVDESTVPPSVTDYTAQVIASLNATEVA